MAVSTFGCEITGVGGAAGVAGALGAGAATGCCGLATGAGAGCLALTTLVELAFFEASTGPSATGAILTPAIGANVFCCSLLAVLLVVTPLFILITYLTTINSNIFLIFFQYKRLLF